MIYVTGDLHGDLERFKTKPLKHLKKNDTLIVCGDFGFVWNGSREEEKILRWLGKRRYHILFVEGTHDNLSLLENYPAETWMGGQVRRISGNLMQMVRGSLFHIESSDIFVMGGGESADIDTRVLGETWWSQEMPTQEEFAAARQRLEENGNVVDYVITHECSTRIRSFLDMDEMRVNPLNAFLEEVEQKVRFKGWFFGSYHLDKRIPPKHHALFREVVALK